MIPSQTLYYNYANSLPKSMLPLGMPVIGDVSSSLNGSQNNPNNPGLEAYLNALRRNPNQEAYQKAEEEIYNTNPTWDDSFSYSPTPFTSPGSKKLS